MTLYLAWEGGGEGEDRVGEGREVGGDGVKLSYS